MPPLSTPDAGNEYLGAGEFKIDLYTPAGAPSGLWRHFGNVKDAQIQGEVESIESENHMTGAGGVYASATQKVGGKLIWTMTEHEANNLALASLGLTTAFSQSSGSATDASIATAVKKGYAVATGKLNITVTGAKKSPATPLVEGVDFAWNARDGLITILPGATAIADGDTLLWSGSYAAITNELKVLALKNANILTAIKFTPAADMTGPKRIADIFKVKISPKAILSLIADGWSELAMEAPILADTTRVGATQSQYYELTPV